MGSYPGTCEIVESNEELDSVKHSKGTNPTSSGLGMDERVGKLPMLKTGRNYSVENDLNQLFEAIDRRTGARGPGSSPHLGAGSSSKGASKKPIRVGVSQASGIGISESMTLKQALRGLCISHASEMAAMKRLSKPVGLPRVSEAGAIKNLYRAVVVDAKESGLPLDEGNGGVVEISLVTEESTSNSSDKIPESVKVPRKKSSNPSAHTSPRSAVATTTKVTTTKTPPQDEIFPKSTKVGGETKALKLEQKGKLNYAASLPSSNTIKKVLELDETIEISTKVGGETKTLKLEQKGKLNYSSSLPSSNTIKKVLELDEIIEISTEVGSKTSTLELVHKGEQYVAGKVSKSAGNSPRLVKPSFRQKSFVKKNVKQDLTTSSNSSNTCNEVYKDDFGTTKVNHAPSLSSSNTIKNVLGLDEIVHASTEVGIKTSMLELAQKGNKYAACELSKSAGNSPRMVKPAFRHKSSVKKKVKQDLSSASNSPNTNNEVYNDDLVLSTSKLACRAHNSNQKNVGKESASPSSRSTDLSIEASSSTVDSSAGKRGLSSNSCGNRTLGTKVSERSRSREKGKFSQSSKSSIGEYSSSTSISEESNLSGSSFIGNRPHMSKDLRWDAIRHVELRHGSLGLRNFKLLKRLGCGDIGTVYLAELTGTSCPFALKVMDNEFLASRKKMPRARTEREILQMLDHPFLPTLYAHFTTDQFSCLVMEYCPGGDLHVLRQRQPSRCFSEQAARFYVAEVLLALEYLHMLGVVYRDLKPENILVREDGHIMLSDFDLSLRCTVSPTLLQSSSSIMEPTKKPSGPCTDSSCIDPFCLQPSWVQVSCFSPRLISAAAKTRKLKSDLATQVSPLPQLVAEPTSARSNSFVGTHEYLAPEIIKAEGHGSAVDWWTFGIFLYELLFGKTPFKGSGNEDTLANVVSQSLKFPESPSVSFQARDLIRGLLVKEPENRLGSVKGATEIKQHPFFEGLNWALIRCAVPPEMPKFCDPGVMAVACQKKESKCPEFRTTGEHLEFELF